MGTLFLVIFLVTFGLNILFSQPLPIWLIGVLAVLAGLMLGVDRWVIRPGSK